MASVDHMEGVYSLMPDHAAADSTGETIRPRTRSTPNAEKSSSSKHHEPASRRYTSIGSRKISTESLTPLIIEEEKAHDSETDEENTTTNASSAEENTILQEDSDEDAVFTAEEENDVLVSLTDLPMSPTGRRKGILKRSSVVELSGSFSGHVQSPTSSDSPLSPSPSVDSRGGWRRESKVKFKPQPSTENTIGKRLVCYVCYSS